MGSFYKFPTQLLYIYSKTETVKNYRLSLTLYTFLVSSLVLMDLILYMIEPSEKLIIKESLSQLCIVEVASEISSKKRNLPMNECKISKNHYFLA